MFKTVHLSMATTALVGVLLLSGCQKPASSASAGHATTPPSVPQAQLTSPPYSPSATAYKNWHVNIGLGSEIYATANEKMEVIACELYGETTDKFEFTIKVTESNDAGIFSVYTFEIRDGEHFVTKDDAGDIIYATLDSTNSVYKTDTRCKGTLTGIAPTGSP